MRIIKEGRIPETVEHETTCRKCSTVFAWKITEAKYQIDQRDGDFYRINCPLCQQEAYVDARIARQTR